jgi:uncharacterized protein YrrD
MLHTLRRSQVIGLTTIDQSTHANLGTVDEVWMDRWGRIRCFSSATGYLPLEQISQIGLDAVSTYGDLPVAELDILQRLYQFPVKSTLGNSLGWVEDFLFDWQSGDIVAYILAGDIAIPWGGRVVLFPEGVASISETALIVDADAWEKLQGESEGLQGFLSEKSHQVRQLVHTLSDRLHHLITPHDKPEIVQVKIRQASDELTNANGVDHSALGEATAFLQEHWQSFQQGVVRATLRLKAAMDKAWLQLSRGKSR